MARTSPHLCSQPGCRAILDHGAGRCAEHAYSYRWKGAKHTGYGARWRRLRTAALARDGHRCTRCRSIGPLEVHHIHHLRAGDPGFYDLAEVEVLCLACHRSATGREGARVRRQRTG